MVQRNRKPRAILKKKIEREFKRLNDRMVEEAVEMMEDEHIPETLENFQRALDATWNAFTRCN